MNPHTLIKSERDVSTYLQPVVLGADTLSYSYARCFHEAYGVNSIVIGTADQKFVSSSRFVDYRMVPHADQEATMLDYLDTLGRELEGKKVPILVGCGDWYARIFSQNKQRLERYFVVPYIDFDLLDRITQKGEFYRICEKLGIPYPKTWSFDCSDPNVRIPVDEFTYPVIAKPSNSARYHYAEFPGKEKVFTIETPEKLEYVFTELQKSVYDKDLIVQDCVPGDDAHLRSITCFSDKDGNVLVSCIGQVLLQDHHPTAIGNPVCIIDDKQPDVVAQAAKFLKETHYEGFSNFDAKYDERDGTYKFFEVNTRPGRNTYYLTLAGVNFVTLFVDHYVLGKTIKPRVADKDFLFQMVPKSVIKRYVAEPERSRALARIKAGDAGCPLFYRKDTLAHLFWSAINYFHQITKFRKYLGKPANSKTHYHVW
ncbi:ATP-grasp domain-containing protein [Bifidobacterium sp. CP2]|uniref:carboxylate--amine ligase n=1 Tax=Bifidobacterium sp. CP2 TaxID=2809025 RepID=UPI001BDC82DF|nr:ATP-grasp domain-containing protein [Bifidobacterium sp. CP2]MBT1181115.1 ATP-grasp domain-containing protein [Bifidobacterium sp. CP2]